ncbi:MAG TPA: hypothetical protein VNN80_26935 [Polyangiaceae bacterium]|jgi:hypothetical protein|nr:hypothetical protein [Polyangiaceae bacterium]
MSRFGFAVAWGLAVGGCGSDAPEPSPPADGAPAADEPEAEAVTGEADDEFDVRFTGQAVVMNARAELRVNEGEREVQLTITGRTPGTDVIVIALTFDGLENTFGRHSVQFSLPEGGPHDVNGSLGGEWYYSQSGQAEIDLTAAGRLDGHFEIALAHADESQSTEPFEFRPSAESAPLVGSFSVPWVLSCHSRLAGHGILQPGGEFCDDLEL